MCWWWVKREFCFPATGLLVIIRCMLDGMVQSVRQLDG
jgi:hypothetical protein